MEELKRHNILTNLFSKIEVINEKTEEKIAVITNDMITTASDEIVVKLTPGNQCSVSVGGRRIMQERRTSQ